MKKQPNRQEAEFQEAMGLMMPYLEMATGESPAAIKEGLLSRLPGLGDSEGLGRFLGLALFNTALSAIQASQISWNEGDLYSAGMEVLEKFHKEDEKAAKEEIEEILQQASEKSSDIDLSSVKNSVLLRLSGMGMMQEGGVLRFLGPEVNFQEAWFTHNLWLSMGTEPQGTGVAFGYNMGRLREFYFVVCLGRRAGELFRSRIPAAGLAVLEALYHDENAIGRVLSDLMPMIRRGTRDIKFPLGEMGEPVEPTSSGSWQAKDEKDGVAGTAAFDAIRSLREKKGIIENLSNAASDKLKWYIAKSAVNRVRYEARRERKRIQPESAEALAAQGWEPEADDAPRRTQEHMKDLPGWCQRLTERQREVVIAVMNNGTQAKAAKKLGVTEAYVSKVIKQAREAVPEETKREYGLDFSR